MNIALGNSALLLGLLGCIGGIITLVIGLARGREQLLRTGRSYTWVMLAGALLATFALQRALISHDFTLRYVADNDSVETPILFRVTAMWSALQGSLLLWVLVLCGYIGAVTVHFRRRATDRLVATATAVSYCIAAFFFSLILFTSNPFDRISGAIPTDGPGPDPLLQNHVLVAFHPPMLYLGLVGFTVPFSFAIASLITSRLGEGWLVETRRWTLFAWGFLSAGVVLGAWWSYQVLGWGGYWGWDPVENSAFLPWLTATAFLHSVMIQERRGMLRVWNLSLLVSTFSLTILGTFLTRSGVLASVHSFAGGSVGPALLGFFALVAAVSIGLLAWRGEKLRSPGLIDSPLSREGAFLANNLLFGAFAFVVLLGTVFPLIIEAINGSQITIGAPFFDTMTMPIAICLLFLMAIAPVLPWRKASGELLRHRLTWPAIATGVVLVVSVVLGARGLGPLVTFALGTFAGASALRQLILGTARRGWRGLVGRANGGMIVHLGVVVISVAFAASHAYQHQTEVTLSPGQSTTFEGHRLTFEGVHSVSYATHSALQADLQLDGKVVYHPAVSNYPLDNEAVGTPAIASSLTHDIYLTLATVPDTGDSSATIGVIIEPLVTWLWIGGFMVVLGTALAAWPGRRRRPTDPVSALSPAQQAEAVLSDQNDAETATVGTGA